MSKQIVISEQHRIAAVFSAEQIQELVVATGTHQVSDIYLGVVENVLPGIDAAFVNIGDSDRNGFIHVTDLGPLRLRRSAASITELLAPQQKVLVQVMKEPTGTKGPRLTGNISLPGRYLVLMPYGRGVNLSRRISSENERNRLRALAVLMKPAGMGVLIRTEADGMPEEAIIEDLENLQKQWESVLLEAANTRAPALLNRDDDFVQRVLRDAYNDDVNRIVVDSAQGLKRVKYHLTSWGGGRMPQGVLVDQHRERGSILEYFRVHAAIREAMKPRVDLPSGGYIIIEKTEALTVIDVNSGSFTRSATARETVLWTNCESATEIARQLRLRNIAGVIVVDFIDMESRRDKLQVLEHFNNAMRSDKAKPQIAQLTELGLVELTRKRQGKNIYELFGVPCTTCSGLGIHAHLPGEAPSALQIQHQYHHYEEIPDHFAPQASPSSDREPESREGIRESRDSSRSRARGRSESRSPSYREAYTPGVESLPSGFEEGYESDGTLDLSQHPSYQERGRGGNRRRRRRGEPFTKEVSGRSTLPWSESTTDRPTNDRIPSRYDSPPEEEEEAEEAEVPEFQPERALSVESRESSRETRESRFEERRNRGRRDRVPSEPPEVIHVEMTPDEQDVYAWMGVSPLILYPLTPKNPRSAVIKVHAPGEAPPVEEITSEEQSSGSDETTAIEADFSTVMPEFEESQGQGERRQRGRVERRSDGSVAPPIKRSSEDFVDSGFEAQEDYAETYDGYPSEPSLEPQPEDVPLNYASEDYDSKADANEDENGAPRRRRRRSSATI